MHGEGYNPAIRLSNGNQTYAESVEVVNHFLMFVVIFGPTVLAICVEIMSEEVRKHRYWKYGVIVFGVTLSILTWVQISVQESASKHDQQVAIEHVASETSQKVTKVVSVEYQSVVTNLTNQIAYLKSQIASESKDLNAIRGSNIVSGKKPVKVEVVNPQRQPMQTATQPVNVSWTQDAGSVNGKHSVTVTVTVDNYVAIPAFLATCDGPCQTQSASVPGESIFQGLGTSNDPNVTGFVFTIPRPLQPNLSIDWTIVSATRAPISVLKVRLLAPTELPESLRQ